MGNPLQFGNQEINLADFTKLVTIAGPVVYDDRDPDAIFLKFERQTYTREEVMALCEIVACMRPDECGLSEGDLRLWWD